MTDLISVSSAGAIATFCLCDERRRNALSADMLLGLIDAFERLTPDHRTVVLRASSDAPVWCAGFDIKALAVGTDPLAEDGLLKKLFQCISSCSVPIIGMIHGSTWGGGTDLALRCDILVGDETAEFAFTPARLGLPYDGDGLLNVLLRVGPTLALEMFATALPVKADRAFQCRILNHLVDGADLEEFTVRLAGQIAANAPLTVTSAKRHIRALAAAMPLPASVAQALAESRNRALWSVDYGEGLAAFREKRKPCFKGR